MHTHTLSLSGLVAAFVLYSWVSGISGVAHPAVWASVLHYKHCCMLGERVGGVSLCLVYSTNHTHPFLFEFKSHGINDQEFIRCSAHTDVQVCIHRSVQLQCYSSIF